MKKFAIVIVVAFLAALLASSCNREICPAYTDAGSSNTEHIG
ncbi:MAG: hypothetical protein R6W67_00755 [Bacteroidales bacterium]